MDLQPYVFFDGRCEEAIAFYRRALGAEVKMMMRYKECPQPEAIPPGKGEKVMHARLEFGRNVLLMSDGHAEGMPKFEGFALSITTTSEAESRRLFAALAEGGKVNMPMEKTFFSPCFGMVFDPFGVLWMVMMQG